MKQKKTIKKNRLIASGGQGCIFEPALKCNLSKKPTQKRKKLSRKKHIISKVTFHRRSSKREYEMNQYIRDIPGYDRWAIVWEDYCDTQPYEIISKTSDIKRCMDKKSIKPTKNETFPMLIGVYGGKSLDDITLELYKPSVFDSQKSFDKVLSRVYKSLRGVEKGISEMKSHGMCHGDLSGGNVVIKRGKSKIIDFGLSCTDTQLSYLSKRLQFISKIDRIYEPYPYEYMCNAMNKAQLKRELKEFQYRDRFEGYIDIYETVLGVSDQVYKIQDYLQERIDDKRKPRTVKYIFENVDTYSLGALIPTILLDAIVYCEVSNDVLQDLCHNSHRQDIFDFCKEKLGVFDV